MREFRLQHAFGVLEVFCLMENCNPKQNRAEAAASPSTPSDRPASAARRKIHYAGRVIKTQTMFHVKHYLFAFVSFCIRLSMSAAALCHRIL